MLDGVEAESVRSSLLEDPLTPVADQTQSANTADCGMQSSLHLLFDVRVRVVD